LEGAVPFSFSSTSATGLIFFDERSIAHPCKADRHRHRDPAAPPRDGEFEPPVGLSLVADAVGGRFVPDFLALALAEDQAQVLELAEVRAAGQAARRRVSKPPRVEVCS